MKRQGRENFHGDRREKLMKYFTSFFHEASRVLHEAPCIFTVPHGGLWGSMAMYLF